MLLEADDIDEAEVGVEYVFGCLSVEDADKECDDAFGYYGIAVGGEVEKAVVTVAAAEPYPALAALDEVVVGFVFFVDGGAFFSEFDEVAVFVKPFVEVGKFVNDLLFYFLDGHCLRVVGFEG